MALRVGRPGRHRRRKLADLEPVPLEKDVQWEIVRALRIVGFDVVTTSQPQRAMMTPGIPDLYARHVAWHMRLWLEVKRPGKRPDPAQRLWHEMERECGGTVLVVTSAKDAIEQIARIREA